MNILKGELERWQTKDKPFETTKSMIRTENKNKVGTYRTLDGKCICIIAIHLFIAKNRHSC